MESIALNDASVPAKPELAVRTILFIAVLAAFTVLITWRARVLELSLERDSEQPALLEKLAPDFSASTIDGRAVSLADFRGQKNVVVAFWASWCGPCRLEMPALTRFYRNNHTDSSDFEILAVSIDEDPKDATEFATAQKLRFPVLLDPRQKVADAYQVAGIPTMFIVDKSGKITYGHIGYDVTMEYRLAHDLGIKEKKPAEGDIDGGAGR
jgi:peroxiredoxin